MGKAKAAKKPSSTSKLSTASLFRRSSKNSTGQIDKDSNPSSPPGKSSQSGKGAKGSKGPISKTKPTTKAKGKVTTSSSSSGSSSTGAGKSSNKGPKPKPKQQRRSSSVESATSSASSSQSSSSSSTKPTATTAKKKPAPKKKAGESKKVGERKNNQQKKPSGATSDKTSSASKKGAKGSSAGKGKSPIKSESSGGGNKGKNSGKSRDKDRQNEWEKSSKKEKSPSPKPNKSASVDKLTRKRSRSDADSPPSPKMARSSSIKEEEGESSSGSKSTSSSKKGNKNNTLNSSTIAAAVSPSSSKLTTTGAKNGASVKKPGALAVVASKKKKVLATKKSSSSTSSPVKGGSKGSSTGSKGSDGYKTKTTTGKKTAGTGKGKKAGLVVSKAKVKSKVKPRPKIKLKRMASLNAKAILEASFSFEPQEKKQRSPAPSSSSVQAKVKSMDELHSTKSGTVAGNSSISNGSRTGTGGSSKPIIGTQKGSVHHSQDVMSFSVSTSTSPPPPLSSSSSSLSLATTPKTPKSVGEKKRKSSTNAEIIASRRESTGSSKGSGKQSNSPSKSNKSNNNQSSASSSKTQGSGSRRNSSTLSAPALDGMTKKTKKELSTNPKKKSKVVSTSTSTSTSPLPSGGPDQFYLDSSKHLKNKQKKQLKQGKAWGVDSSTNTSGGEKRQQDSGVQVEHESHQSQTNFKHKSAGSQVKERKSSSTPVAHFGTVYQPAGPLIEPHKSVPIGLLPETVKLPPDLKVTYQTHPPTSNVHTVSHSSSSKASRKSSSSASTSTSTSSHAHGHTSGTGSGGSSHHHKSDKSGQILHQPYKSSQQPSTSIGGSISMPQPRSIQQNYPSSYSVNAGTGSPLIASSSAASILSQQQQSAVAAAAIAQQQHQQQLQQQQLTGAGLTMTGQQHLHHQQILQSHPMSSTGGGMGVGSQQHPSPSGVAAGAPSAGGLFYSQSSGFAPHHSPFAPCKYPMVPPDSYRTHSPYQNSFLYPSTTPGPPSQSYYMTPFYTPPLTPNSAPSPAVLSSGLGGAAGISQPRPLSLTGHHHHPSAIAAAAAASFYQPQAGPTLQPPSAHLHPSNYLVASPHHSIQPSPAAPGHAGLFHPNQSTQPACPCPTESLQLNSTNSSKPLQLQLSVSSVSLPVLEAGAKQPKLLTNSIQSHQALLPHQQLVSTTASRPSRHFHTDLSHLQPPTCTTPAVAADPPITIQLLNSNVDVQARQLESAKTFTEQYSLPDDITITPIIVANSNVSTTNSALLLINSSISIVSTSAPDSTVTSSVADSRTCTSPQHKILSGVGSLSKKKERDIVHVIDPRSGHRTTIAKHISNNNLLASCNNSNKYGKNSPSAVNTLNTTKSSGQSSHLQHKLKPNINTNIGGVRVGKLNPDLDVIVINNNNSTGNGGGSGTGVDDHISENGNLSYGNSPTKVNKLLGPQLSNNMGNGKKGARKGKANLNAGSNSNSNNSDGNISSSNKKSARRIALADNDNNSPLNFSTTGRRLGGRQGQVTTSPLHASNNAGLNYSLPPGISISPGVEGYNFNVPMGPLSGNQNLKTKPMAVQNFQKSDSRLRNTPQQGLVEGEKGSKGNKKRISLNECIDGLQKKRLKLIEEHFKGANGHMDGIPNGDINTPLMISTGRSSLGASKQKQNQNLSSPLNKGHGLLSVRVKETGTSARVRAPHFNMGSTVINSSDAVAAVSAVVLDPEAYELSRHARSLAAAKAKNSNGLHKGKLTQQPRKKFTVVSSVVKKVSSHRMKVGTGLRPLEKGSFLSTRNTRSAAANAKIRTRHGGKSRHLLGSSLGPSRTLGLGDPAQGTSRSRSRLLRKRNQTSPGNRKSESDCSSTNTSRSSSAVRLVQSTGSSGNRDRYHHNKQYPTQAFINAVADLYQYRRNVMLRVPRANAGIFPSASSVNLLNLPGIISPSAEFLSRASLSPGGSDKSVGQQISPTGQRPNVLHEFTKVAAAVIASSNSSPRSSSTSPGNLPGIGPNGSKSGVGSMAANAAKKRAFMKPLSPSSVNMQYSLLGVRRQPKWSNGWRFEGEPYETRVLINNDDQPVLRRCYPAMRHESGDVIQTRDCVLLKSGSKKNDLPYIAKIAALWENPSDGEMMFSLLWYYRPEHTEMGRTKDEMPDEIFASKHIDVNSVATIDDRCYVLTFNEYCRYRKRLKQLEQNLTAKPLIPLTGSTMTNNNAAGNIATAVWKGGPVEPNRSPSPGKISPEVVFFCRKVYDFRQKRIMKNPS